MVSTYKTPAENMQTSVIRCRKEILTDQRSFTGHRKMRKSLIMLWAVEM